MMKKLTIILLAILLSGASPEDARKANEAYNNGDYETAVELYKKAIESNPENARLYFNLGNALANLGHSEEAIRYFEQYKTMTEDPRRQAMADYNIGNVHSQRQQWDRAVNAYKDALRYRDEDIDAKHNYELALRKKNEQQNQDQQQGQNQDQQQQQQQQDQQNQDQDQQQQQQQQNQEQQNQQQQPQQQQMNQISKEEAEKILQALEQKEKELLKEFKKQKTESSNSTNEKDW